MGNCVHCGQPAGLFRSRHDNCERKHKLELIAIDRRKREGLRSLRSAADEALKAERIPIDFSATVAKLIADHSIPEPEADTLLVSAWENAAESFLEDNLISEDEERVLHEFQLATKANVTPSPIFSRVVHNAALREVVNGRIPTQFRIDIPLPFNLQKGETPIWYYKDSNYVEDKARRHFEGASHGVSIRVARGVYYRVGAFKGRPVETTERVRIDNGLFLVTDQHLYFAGDKKSVRIPYKKIISFEPFENAIGIRRDTATAMPQMFTVADGWFVYNLVTNIAAW